MGVALFEAVRVTRKIESRVVKFCVDQFSKVAGLKLKVIQFSLKYSHLEFQSFNVIWINMCISQCVDKVARLEKDMVHSHLVVLSYF